MIGAGFIGQLAHMMNFHELDSCRIVGLAEFKPELRAKVAARYEIPRTYATHTELLNDPEVEAVIVVTPRPFLAPTVLDCIRAGKHVLSEKPMAGNAEQGSQLVKEAKQRNVVYAVGYMKRYDCGVEIAKNAFQNALITGELGTLLSVYGRCFMGNSYCNVYGHVTTQEKTSYPDAGWEIGPKWLPKELQSDYGAFVNCHSHLTNLLRYFFGRTPTVDFASMSSPCQTAVLRFGDVLATVQTGKSSQGGWDEQVRFQFSDGEIDLTLPPALLRNVPAGVEIYSAGKIQQRVKPQVDWSWSFMRQAEAFIRAVSEREVFRSPGEDALEDLLLCEELWKNDVMRTGKSV